MIVIPKWKVAGSIAGESSPFWTGSILGYNRVEKVFFGSCRKRD